MKSMDSGIGKVFDALRKANLERNTLVVFTSDNGGERYSLNWPFQFQKMYLWEGGIRIPAIVRWPGVVPAGKVTNQVVLTMDWSATFLDVAEVKPIPRIHSMAESIMGVCLVRFLRSIAPCLWRLRTKPQDAARMGKWKYLRDTGEEHLFDLAADPGESIDQKKTTGRLRESPREFKKWDSTMLPL